MVEPIRINGFFSTFDTEAVIARLTEARNIRVQKLDIHRARADVRGELIGDLASKFASLLARVNSLTTGFSVTGRTAAVTGSAISASASPSASIGPFTVAVTKLATGTKAQGTAITAALDSVSPMNRANFGTTPTNGTFTVGSAGGGTATIKVGPSVTNAAAMLSASNFATPVTSGTFTLSTATGGSSTLTVDIATQSLADVVTAINASGIGVTASITNDANGRANILSLTSAQGAITVGGVGDTSNFLAATNLNTSTGTTTRVSSAAMSTQMSLAEVVTEVNAAGVGVTASIQNDANGRANLLSVTAATSVVLGNASDTSNFLSATNVLASPAGTTRASTLAIARMNPNAKMVDASFFGGPPAAGAHTFTVNGVSIAYNTANDSMADVIARINGSAAGVSARYDIASDTLRLEQSKTGSLAITLADDVSGGNFLAKTGLLAATQAVGANAEYSIAGGATQYSSSNTVTAAPGVTVTLNALTDVGSPATVTVSQNSSGAIGFVKAFVADFNAALGAIDAATKADGKDRSRAGELSGDATIRQIRSTLRGMISGSGVGVDGAFKNLNEVGIGFGRIGAALGTTGTLQFDEAKFTEALGRDPAAVQALFSSLAMTATLAPGGTSSITGATGTYSGTRAGHYKLIDDGVGHITAEFRPADGGAVTSTTATVTANGTNTSLIPGMTLQIGPAFLGGEHTLNVTATQASPLQQLKQVLESQAGVGGVLSRRQASYQAVSADIQKRQDSIAERIAREMEGLRSKFSNMEQIQARSQRLLATLQQAATNASGNR